MSLQANTRTVEANNTAWASDNKMHDDAYAKSQGYRGGFVPGTDTYAYLTHMAVSRWGMDWLTGGYGEFRLINPVFHRDPATTTIARDGGEEVDVVLTTEDGECVTGSFHRAHAEAEASLEPIAQAPETTERPDASHESLAEGTLLGLLRRHVTPDEAAELLSDLREDLPIYTEQGIVHPGYLMRVANRVLAQNVKLGPWIHVGSRVFNYRPCPIDVDLTAFGTVLRNYDRKGHQFVDLDVRIHAADRGLTQRILHTAIWRPRHAG